MSMQNDLLPKLLEMNPIGVFRFITSNSSLDQRLRVGRPVCVGGPPSTSLDEFLFCFNRLNAIRRYYPQEFLQILTGVNA